MLEQWLLIGILAAVTYASRIAGVSLMGERRLTPAVRLYFQYVPTAIIVALIVKQIAIPSGARLTFSLPVFTGCLAAALVIKILHRFLPAVGAGIAAGLLIRYFL
ncbi:MAG: AzlD domain-containing protein [Sporolactobacillus sp.]|jgi:branched-subunit amino acid transport protein|nr:AzlD domain-containing protein [Sporolactobacillus sp.]MCI1883147.1 AzlD domain-containing protein [Sporolactobacillus sp.]